MSRQIVVCEPQCWGFEHAHFNAAMLDTVLAAYPEARVVYLGEAAQLQWVRQELERHEPDGVRRVTWREMSIPSRRLWGWRRLMGEWTWCRAVVKTAADTQAALLIVCSLTGSGLLTLKLWLYGRRFANPVLAVPHGILSSLVQRQSRRPWVWALSLRQVLRLPHPPGLHYIALGDPIYRSLVDVDPGLATHFRSLNPPYFMEDPRVEELTGSHPAAKLRFGFLGVANAEKGFGMYARLAREVLAGAKGAQAEFSMVGFINDSNDQEDYSWIVGVSRQALTPEEYRERASALTYVVSTADPEHYRLTASATLLDALSYEKPGVFLRNAFVESCFKQMGDIGYLCGSYEEMLETVLSIIRSFPSDRYRVQRENIRRGRGRFTPRQLAARLRGIAGLSAA